MCTAATYRTKDFYFGRTLDYEFSYGEEITVTPRNYPFSFRYLPEKREHYAIIGMAHVEEDYPLYYDAVNEKGLGMAGLNFVGNAVYGEVREGKENVAVFELIPYILSQCENTEEARELLGKIQITDSRFKEQLPNGRLHWIIADEKEAITVESVTEGLKIYENAPGVLTNNPPFPMQMFQLNNYMQLSSRQPENLFSDQLSLETYSRGMGALGLPGDLSSASRFVRVTFTKLHARSGEGEADSVGQFFHILGSVEQTRGCCELENGKYEITIYTSCCNADKGIYYYTTYDNHQISAVDMHKENLEEKELIRYSLVKEEQIYFQNAK